MRANLQPSHRRGLTRAPDGVTPERDDRTPVGGAVEAKGGGGNGGTARAAGCRRRPRSPLAQLATHSTLSLRARCLPLARDLTIVLGAGLLSMPVFGVGYPAGREFAIGPKSYAQWRA